MNSRFAQHRRRQDPAAASGGDVSLKSREGSILTNIAPIPDDNSRKVADAAVDGGRDSFDYSGRISNTASTQRAMAARHVCAKMTKTMTPAPRERIKARFLGDAIRRF